MTTRSWAEIDLDAIEHNARTLRALAPGAALCAVVKANAYGHGELEAAAAAIAGGAEILAVARVEEGQRLRAGGFEQPIWVLSEPAGDEYPAVVASRLEPTVYSVAAIRAAGEAGVPVVHLKVDTGMHRVGSAPDAALGLVEAVAGAGLGLGSVWTHLAVADEPANPFTATQLDCFDRVVAEIEAAGFEVPLRHAANSAGTMIVPTSHYDVVRCGVALYGMAPSPALEGLAELRPALRWVSRVSHVKQLRPGDRVSYGLRTELSEPTVAATVPVGYADGYRRSLWRTPGLVLIGGKRRRVLGVVTMDQMVVDCGADEVAVGDDVVLIGQQGEARVTADELAAALDTINYEITCGISERVGRVHRRSVAT